MAIGVPSKASFSGTSVMGVVGNIVNYLKDDLVPDINSEIETVTSTATVDISQDASGITIGGTALQDASTAQDGLMTSALVTELNTATSSIASLQSTLETLQTTVTSLQTSLEALTTYVGTDTELIAE